MTKKWKRDRAKERIKSGRRREIFEGADVTQHLDGVALRHMYSLKQVKELLAAVSVGLCIHLLRFHRTALLFVTQHGKTGSMYWLV